VSDVVIANMKSMKSLSCGTRCVKYLLIVFNVVFAVSITRNCLFMLLNVKETNVKICQLRTLKLLKNTSKYSMTIMKIFIHQRKLVAENLTKHLTNIKKMKTTVSSRQYQNIDANHCNFIPQDKFIALLR